MHRQNLIDWYNSFATEREACLVHLDTMFTEDVVFRDPFRDTRGVPAFRELFVRMFRRYRHVHFTGFVLEGNEEKFTFTYLMHLRMAVGPTFVTPMATICTARDGKISEVIDYYDFASGLVSPVPLLAKAYQACIRAIFL
ncbi:MAG: nuclear transport factor 2 family protein [Myxococcota bacterium]